MIPSKVAVSLLFLTLTSLLLLGGCEEMPTASNPPAVVPNPQPGAPIAGGLQIAFARATPLLPDMMRWKPGTVTVHFNGAATTEGIVEVSALSGGWNIYRSVGSAKFVPGQTDVQVPIKVDVEQPAETIESKNSGFVSRVPNNDALQG